MVAVNLFGALALDATVVAVRDFLSSLIGSRDDAASATQKGIAALVMRQDSDSISTADGDLSMIQIDEAGRVKTSNMTASFPATVGTANAVTNTVFCDVSRASNVVFHVKNIGSVTLAAGTFVFEGSVDSTNGTDGTWFGIQAIRSNANTVESSIALSGIAAGAGYAAAWEASVNAYKWMRLRCTVAVTTNASAQWTIMRGSYATEPIPGAQISGTQPVSGSLTSAGTTTATPASGSNYNLVTTASTNAAFVKASAGQMYQITVANPTATAVYVKLYNLAVAPTVGTSIPKTTIRVAATGTAGDTVTLNFGSLGMRFNTGIAIAVTAAAAATDTASAVAGVQIDATYL